VVYKGQIIGEYIADLVIDGKIIPSTKLRASLELKAVSKLTPAHEAQAHHYITATGLRLALLINFGASSLEQRRIIR
jgi:GxxExxY protein